MEDEQLLDDWLAALPATGPRARAAGADLLARYGEPQRRYHDRRHLAEVLAAIDRLTEHADPADHPRDVRLAAWFHDAVYDVPAEPGANERASAALAAAVLTDLGLPPDRIARVDALVRMTEHHALGAGGDADAAVLSDADLAILAAEPARYAEYAAAVREEYATVLEPDFRAGRCRILQEFIDRSAIYATATGRALWEARARTNLAAEVARLSG